MDYEYSKLTAKLQTEAGKRIYERLKNEYEKKFDGQPIIALDYTKYKLIYKTGNRTEFEDGFFARRERLAYLQLLALGDDAYLDPLEEIICAICDEYTWLIPSHAYAGNEGREEEFDYTRVDLFASETGFYLSETMHMFGDKLSKDIRYRIKHSVKTKLLDNFENRTFWWEREDVGCNWTAVCAGGIAISYMYLFPERFVLVKDRILAMFKQYIHRAFSDDGVCVEGVGYYGYGIMLTMCFCDIYRQRYGDLPEFIKNEKIQKMFDYHKNSIIDGWPFPFSDVSPCQVVRYGILELITKKVFPDYQLPYFDFVENYLLNREALATRVLDCIGRFDIKGVKNESNKEISRFYESAQIFSYKNKNYLLYVKGGDNNELHNHNDVGCFALYKGDKRIIADIGSGVYTWEYGEDMVARYGEKIFCCGSCSHSVPIVGDTYQTYGENTRANLLSKSENNIKFEISNAYRLKDTYLTVEYDCKENGLIVNYEYKGEEQPITFRFMSDFEPNLGDDKVMFGDVEVRLDIPYKLTYNKRQWETYSGTKWIWAIDFTISKAPAVNAKFEFII